MFVPATTKKRRRLRLDSTFGVAFHFAPPPRKVKCTEVVSSFMIYVCRHQEDGRGGGGAPFVFCASNKPASSSSCPSYKEISSLSFRFISERERDNVSIRVGEIVSELTPTVREKQNSSFSPGRRGTRRHTPGTNKDALGFDSPTWTPALTRNSPNLLPARCKLVAVVIEECRPAGQGNIRERNGSGSGADGGRLVGAGMIYISWLEKCASNRQR